VLPVVALAVPSLEDFVRGSHVDIVPSNGKTGPCAYASRLDALMIGACQVIFQPLTSL
jgi:hypothetical protein